MRLFLSSQDLGHYAELAFEMCGPGKRVACVINAQDYLDASEREEKVARKKLLFESAGFAFQELDLRQYFGRPEELEKYLQDFDLVWCNGGNTFILRRAMRASGLDTILKKRLADDTIMYGGSSAGSCVCAPSLHGIECGDRPHHGIVPAGYPDASTIWEGLGLVPFMIIPHGDQEWFSGNVDPTIQALQDQGAPYQLLNDGEVVIVENDATKILQPSHDNTRYWPITQKPYCCVPTSLQMVLQKNKLPKLSQEIIGNELGLIVPPEYADEFENVQVSEEPIVSSGFGTRIQDPDFSLERLIKKQKWPFTLTKRLASDIKSEQELLSILTAIEKQDDDALICYQNNKGYGHVVVFDRVIGDKLRIIDPSPNDDKWREVSVTEMHKRIQAHGDKNFGGVWLLERT